MTKYILPKITNTGDCTPAVTDVHSCIQMELFFFCFDGTKVKARWIPGTDFHMQAQVFTEKVSCQGLFWKEK